MQLQQMLNMFQQDKHYIVPIHLVNKNLEDTLNNYLKTYIQILLGMMELYMIMDYLHH